MEFGNEADLKQSFADKCVPKCNLGTRLLRRAARQAELILRQA
jgi:hypothetical protein